MKKLQVVNIYFLLFFTIFSVILLSGAESLSTPTTITSDTTIPANLDLSGEVEWKTKTKDNGGAAVHGVYNPSTKSVEWKTEPKDKGRAAIHGVYNPSTKSVEWKTETKAQDKGEIGELIDLLEGKNVKNYGLGASVYGVWKPNDLDNYKTFLSSDKYYRSIDNYQMYYP